MPLSTIPPCCKPVAGGHLFIQEAYPLALPKGNQSTHDISHQRPVNNSSLLFLQKIGGTLAKIFLIAFGKIGRRRESDFIGNFSHGLLS